MTTYKNKMSTDSSFVCAALGISGSSSSSPSSSPECLVKQPQGPHTSSISYNFVPDFFQACDQDATQVALDLVQASLHDKRRRSLLELFAKRMLQELMLAETTTTTMAVNTNKVPTNLPTPPKYTFSAPYSKDVHAEMGDSGFEIFRELMRPIECLELGLHRRIPRPSQDAKRIFGESIANAAIPIYQQLQNSFILYSPSWKTTTNQDTKTSSIPDDLLLVMLPYQKLPHADSNILHKIVTDFECSEILKAALDDWGLENEFSSLYQNYTNVGRSKASLKCLVFVARAYKCMYALQWTDIRDSLAGKVLQCLEILQQNISQPSSSAPPLKKKPRYTWDPPSTNNKKRHITKYHPAPVVWTAVPSCSSKILTDQDVAQLSRSEIMNMPVEKLCLETGRMLENFATAEEARRSVTNSDFQQPFVEVLKGNYRGGRVYKEFYWRLQDTHNSPLDE